MPTTAPDTGVPDGLAALLARLEGILARVEPVLPPAPPAPDCGATAFRWRKRAGRGHLQAVLHPHAIRADDLVAVDEQKRAIYVKHVAESVAGLPANNVLLTGSRGTGKSSLVKAMLAKYAAKGLRLIEVDKADLVDLPDIAEAIRAAASASSSSATTDVRRRRARHKVLKVMLDGIDRAAAPNLLIYATSNRRHLLPKYFSENLETRHVGEEVHPGESVEEKISLSERFGLWISFYPFGQEDYLAAVAGCVDSFGVGARSGRESERRKREALQFALQRGSRSGRWPGSSPGAMRARRR